MSHHFWKGVAQAESRAESGDDQSHILWVFRDFRSFFTPWEEEWYVSSGVPAQATVAAWSIIVQEQSLSHSANIEFLFSMYLVPCQMQGTEIQVTVVIKDYLFDDAGHRCEERIQGENLSCSTCHGHSHG